MHASCVHRGERHGTRHRTPEYDVVDVVRTELVDPDDPVVAAEVRRQERARLDERDAREVPAADDDVETAANLAANDSGSTGL